MPFSLRRNTPSGHVGLDVDGSYLAAAQVVGGRVVRTSSRELPEGLLQEGEVRDVAGLSAELKDFFSAEALPRSVSLGVANQQIVVRHLEMPRIADEKDRDAAVRFQTAEAVAMPLEEAVVDYQVVGEDKGGDGTARQRILVVAARKTMVERLVEAVHGAGLKPTAIDLNAFALIRTLAAEAPGAEDSARVYCHLGDAANIAVARGRTCLFTRLLTSKWEDAEGGVEALCEEMRLSIDYYRTQADMPAVADVVLSGPGARAEGVARQVGDMLHLPVTVAEPLGRFGDGTSGSDDPFRHTVSVGLAVAEAA